MHLSLFGSAARGEMNALSDIDLLVDFDQSRQITLVTISQLEAQLAELLGRRVEVSSPSWMREHIRDQALREAVVAF